MENMIIRKAGEQDVDAIYEFVCGLEDEVFDKATFTKCYHAVLGKPHHHYLLAVADSRAVGYISCHGQVLLHHCGLVYEIQEMYVAEQYRSAGIGRMLLKALYEEIGHRDHILLEVASNMKRQDAHRFYEENGFVKTTYKFKKQN